MTRDKKPLRQHLLLLLVIPGAIAALAIMAWSISSQGQEEARKMDLQSVQQAVSLMMVENNLSILPNPITEPTNDMRVFPDAITTPQTKGLLDGDKPGYVLRAHDATPDGQPEPVVDYIGSSRTTWTYTVTRAGVVNQREVHDG